MYPRAHLHSPESAGLKIRRNIIRKDTPPFSPGMENQMENEDIVYVEDIDDLIAVYDAEDAEDELPIEEEEVADKGNATCIFSGHKQSSVICGALSKNGKLAVSGGQDDMAYVWDTKTGEVVLECTGHKDTIIFAEFNHDDSYVATGDLCGGIKVWRMNDKVCIWDYNMGDAQWMMWHMAANVLLAGSTDGEVYMWKLPDGNCKVFQGYGCRATVGALFPDGKQLAVGYKDGSIRIIDLKTSLNLAMIPPNSGHSSAITTIDCHSDNNLILSADFDGKTVLSTRSNGKIIGVLQALNGTEGIISISDEEVSESSNIESDRNWVETAAFCKDPHFQVAATGTINGEIFVWDISKQILRQKLQQEGGISKLLWKGNTSILFSAGLDGILRCFNAKAGQCLCLFTGHTADILDIYISENGENALTTSDDSTARIFDISTLS